jgi:8-oxo-dGTP diphosphatase
MPRYAHPDRLLIALDCIIFGFDGETLRLLLIKRAMEPAQGQWSLVGGFLSEAEDLDEAARRILFELTGLENVYMEQLQTFGKPDRDPAERTVSVGFFALIDLHSHDAELARRNSAHWVTLKSRPSLIFDHDSMVTLALQRLQYRAALHPIGFELLPQRFTIPQLHKLYEAIYGLPMDRRNFSRKLLSTGLLLPTGEKDDQSATRKATLYELDKGRYQQQLDTNAFMNLVAGPTGSV